jgi:hypothetical protein
LKKQIIHLLAKLLDKSLAIKYVAVKHLKLVAKNILPKDV